MAKQEHLCFKCLNCLSHHAGQDTHGYYCNKKTKDESNLVLVALVYHGKKYVWDEKITECKFYEEREVEI